MKQFISILALCLSLMPVTGTLQAQDFKYLFENPGLSIDQRVDDLVSRLTLEEKTDQLSYNSPAVERLGVQPSGRKRFLKLNN